MAHSESWYDMHILPHLLDLACVWTKIAGGCHLTRDVPQLLRSAGFAGVIESGYIARPKTLGYNFWGEATAE